ncbi:hypothetical protein RRG08_064002 [Elysia crispata]|uniref:Uncharacterized protein n=1 Tax=Elysia crispata TaxID=231223 RepID=A0AAE0YEL7_9GAST|nr:hypothetical protein RRG08_064002 [Elysia crispata]
MSVANRPNPWVQSITSIDAPGVGRAPLSAFSRVGPGKDNGQDKGLGIIILLCGTAEVTRSIYLVAVRRRRPSSEAYNGHLLIVKLVHFTFIDWTGCWGLASRYQSVSRTID